MSQYFVSISFLGFRVSIKQILFGLTLFKKFNLLNTKHDKRDTKIHEPLMPKT